MKPDYKAILEYNDSHWQHHDMYKIYMMTVDPARMSIGFDLSMPESLRKQTTDKLLDELNNPQVIKPSPFSPWQEKYIKDMHVNFGTPLFVKQESDYDNPIPTKRTFAPKEKCVTDGCNNMVSIHTSICLDCYRKGRQKERRNKNG